MILDNVVVRAYSYFNRMRAPATNPANILTQGTLDTAFIATVMHAPRTPTATSESSQVSQQTPQAWINGLDLFCNPGEFPRTDGLVRYRALPRPVDPYVALLLSNICDPAPVRSETPPFASEVRARFTEMYTKGASNAGKMLKAASVATAIGIATFYGSHLTRNRTVTPTPFVDYQAPSETRTPADTAHVVPHAYTIDTPNASLTERITAPSSQPVRSDAHSKIDTSLEHILDRPNAPTSEVLGGYALLGAAITFGAYLKGRLRKNSEPLEPKPSYASKLVAGAYSKLSAVSSYASQFFTQTHESLSTLAEETAQDLGKKLGSMRRLYEQGIEYVNTKQYQARQAREAKYYAREEAQRAYQHEQHVARTRAEQKRIAIANARESQEALAKARAKKLRTVECALRNNQMRANSYAVPIEPLYVRAAAAKQKTSPAPVQSLYERTTAARAQNGSEHLYTTHPRSSKVYNINLGVNPRVRQAYPESNSNNTPVAYIPYSRAA